MSLSNDLISQFAKIIKVDNQEKKETTVKGTIVVVDDKKYVKLDGSDRLTPISTTTDVQNDERVNVLIKDHTATVTGNLSSPAARTDDVQEIGSKISEFEIVIADKVSVKDFDAQTGRIDDLVSDNVLIKDTLTATEADIKDLKAQNVTIEGKLEAADAKIENLEANSITVDIADAKYATIENLEATNADIYNLEAAYGEFVELTTTNFESVNADITNLETDKLSAKDADLKYANIDFSNIGKAAIEQFFSKSGMISDLVVGEGTVTGKLVGVTIIGDLIEGGTVKADKLVIKGEDGLFYKLNVDAMGEVGTEEVPTDSLHGSVITANSITAEKISVKDLVAFGATIGGFIIDDDSIHTLTKDSPTNTTRGIYLDNNGQFSIGDSNNYLRYFKDTDGTYKLQISAGSIRIKSGTKTLEEELEEIRDEVTTNLRIESSRGTVFKNDNISTVLSAVIYRGSQRITNITDLRAAMGSSAYLQWKWQRLDETSFGVISSSDKRLGNDGFTFTLSPEDVDTKVTFMCELIV